MRIFVAIVFTLTSSCAWAADYEGSAVVVDGDTIELHVADRVLPVRLSTAIVEQFFDSNFKRADPAVALCGLDNAMGRLALDGAGFPIVIEAGLGRNHRNFQTIRLHTLPASRTAAEIWSAHEEEDDALTTQPSYEKLLEEGHLDQCGVTLLAGKAVGAPFVGATAATLLIAEILRLLHGGRLSQLIDLDLRSPDNRILVPGTKLPTVNPGYTMAKLS